MGQCFPDQQNQNQDSSLKSLGTNQPYQFSLKYLDHCDCIQINKDQKQCVFVLSRFTIYFGQFNIEKCQKEGNGWILQRCFDGNYNSSYFHYDGQFANDQIVGRGKLFIHKSKIIRQEEEWLSITKTLSRFPQISIKPAQQKIKFVSIIDNQTGEISDNIKPKPVYSNNNTILYYDQLLNLNDLYILKRTSWLNSSIIDAYIEQLNYQDEVSYWSKIKDKRKEYQRLCIIPSWLFSWFHKERNEQNLKYFQEIYSQFEPIQYRIWEIYKKIGVVVNSNNMHWYFVQLDFETMEIIIKDSMRGRVDNYTRTVDILQNLFHQIDKKIKFKGKVCQECLQQGNGYDCGAYTCINAQILAKGKLPNIKNGRDMRNFLVDFMLHA